MSLDLGGPGFGCSAMRVRRLLSGELTGAEKERTEAHVSGCARCEATHKEILAEREALRRDVPFPQFAAAVAEKLASKGGGSAQLFVQDARGVRELSPGEPVAAGARLLLTLHPAGRKRAAAVLIEPGGVGPGETSVLYQGPAVNGPLPQAFEWTGTGSATLLVVLSDTAVDAAQIHSAKDAPRGADVLLVKLHR